MTAGKTYIVHRWLSPPHPCWRSSLSSSLVTVFLESERTRAPGGVRINIGSAARRFSVPVVNLDLFPGDQVDIAGDALQLPLAPASVDTVICTGVLEHLPDPSAAVLEIVRVLKPGGRVYAETPFMQTYHASPGDYHRWTFQGLAWIFHDFEILEIRVASGPASALAWQLQQTAAMLFSFRSDFIYRVGLRIFGWLAVPVAWLDIFLEQHPSSRNAASGFALIARKPEKEST